MLLFADEEQHPASELGHRLAVLLHNVLGRIYIRIRHVPSAPITPEASGGTLRIASSPGNRAEADFIVLVPARVALYLTFDTNRIRRDVRSLAYQKTAEYVGQFLVVDRTAVNLPIYLNNLVQGLCWRRGEMGHILCLSVHTTPDILEIESIL